MAPFYSDSYLKFHSLESKKNIVGYKRAQCHSLSPSQCFLIEGFFWSLGFMHVRVCPKPIQRIMSRPSLVLHFIQMPKSFLHFDFYTFYISVSLTKMWFLIMYAGSHTDINVDLWDSHGSNCFFDILIVTWIACLSGVGTFLGSTLRIFFLDAVKHFFLYKSWIMFE